MASVSETLEVEVRESLRTPGLQRLEVSVLKEGPRVYKTVSMMYFGKAPDSVSKKEICFQSWTQHAGAFQEKPKARFRCEADEVDRIRMFLESEYGGPGEYQVVGGQSELLQALANVTEDRSLKEAELAEMLNVLSDQPDLLTTLITSSRAEQLRAAAEVARSQKAVKRLVALVDDADTPEIMFQRLLEDNWWLLGGQYVDRLDRRRFTALDEVDLALVRTDGVAHVVELKKAFVPDLVVEHRNHHRVGDSVNEAVNQVANYLRVFDERVTTLQDDFAKLRIGFRRVQATVVIGHPNYANVDHDQARQALRIYNSHLSRIEVLTYEDLIRSGEAWLSRMSDELTGEVKPGQPRTEPVRTVPDEAPF